MRSVNSADRNVYLPLAEAPPMVLDLPLHPLQYRFPPGGDAHEAACATRPLPFSQWREEVPFPTSSGKGSASFPVGRPAASAAISGAAVRLRFEPVRWAAGDGLEGHARRRRPCV